MIPHYYPHELIVLTDEELDALFAYIRRELMALEPNDPERITALDLLDDIRAELKRRINRCFGWAYPVR